MRLIGLTGGIGMGKSTAAAFFRRHRLPVFDADAAVQVLQAPGGAALPAIAAAFPGTVTAGALNRAALRAAVIGKPDQLKRLEAILHPRVRALEKRFIARARAAGAQAVILDIPLLFETRGQRGFDHIVVVSAPSSVQRARVRARGRMSDSQIDAIIARQMPDRQKRRLADTVIQTGLSRAHALRQLTRLLQEIRR